MVLGIDLGTTYSVGAYVDKEGMPQIIDNSEGAKITPSVVLFDGEQDIVVGDIAKENAVIRSDDVVSVVKRYMGQQVVLKERGGQKYTPEMISSFILRKIVQDAERAVGEKVTNAVITVPAYFTDAQRKSTEDAVALAGISLLGTINEPTAAALCYIHKHKIQNGNMLIYDLGGGTFDVTILQVKDSKIEVLATSGLSSAGGRFFDQYIVDYVNEYMSDKHDIDLEEEDYADELQELYIKAESAKMQLSSRNSATIVLKIGKIKEQIVITKEQFEGMIKKLYVRTENKMKEALKEANLSPQQIDKVLLVGGSSRIPYIGENIQNFIGKEPSREVNPDEAVAIGAALYAQMNVSEGKNNIFTDVCSHSIGVVVQNEKGERENNIIIKRNSVLPVESQQRFRTIIANQKRISLRITEGEYKELTDVKILGTFAVDLPLGLKERELVIIKISLDQNQLIHITLALPEVQFEKEYQLKRVSNMDEETVKNVTEILMDYKIS